MPAVEEEQRRARTQRVQVDASDVAVNDNAQRLLLAPALEPKAQPKNLGMQDAALERRQIEGKEAPEIAKELTGAFDQFCAPESQPARAAD